MKVVCVARARSHPAFLLDRMRTAWITMRPETMALVVAIAWTMFPAIPLASNSVWGGMR